ncbi:BREX-1 system adenine-specific DNA-methyltransferase PglX [Lactobacillus johnsonii]|uniref:site-specific DNA-methyltransferase (adenine-specific) n=1 Tax=Lactobacillus johnsonii TaxID=33959 RepID=A0A9X0J6H9_LACJH|nr:BREX-1 system adenine-specific DNA-methyltransferase PglX [Lactobacillus johnsonii]KXN75818.1 restriction endonuclease subunit M [Lactobacillus johnsonii]
MDKNKIKKFAINARKSLRDTTEVQLANLGITDEKINDELSISTKDKKYYVDDNENNALTGKQIGWRKDVVNELKNRGYDDDPKTVFDDFIEEVAYTWFNRIIAIRFMEVNNYLPSRVSVLTSEEGKAEPDIINEAMEIEDDLGGYSDSEKELISTALTERTPELMDKLYAMLFIKQCDALSDILPGLFEKTNDYLKLLFTPNYNRGVIQDLINEIPASYFDVNEEGQVQIIGWLYQYYNSELKDTAFKKKKYQTDDIAPVTQLFTPDWIVRYMVENSLGRYWVDILHSRGDERSEKEIANEFGWKYYMPASDQNNIGLDKELANKDVKDIKFIDPAMGSGHILVYAFDVFMQIYESEGYSKRDAAVSILKNNLYGLDIDKRAYQLSSFALLMKAREKDRRLFRRDYNINLFDVPRSRYDIENYQNIIDSSSNIDKDKTRSDLKNILDVFKYGDDLGSIINISKDVDISDLKELISSDNDEGQIDLLSDSVKEELEIILNVVEVLNNKYDVSVTNPPYMGGGKMDAPLKKYVQKNYPDSKADLFSVFMEKLMSMTKDDGYIGMVTMHSWMFLSNFEKLRKKLQKHTIINMAHLGTRAFEEIGGEVVQTTTFILQGRKNNGYVGNYERLVDYGSQDGKEEKYLEIVDGKENADLYQVNQDNFHKISGSPIAYWASENLIEDFEKGIPLGKLVDAKEGMGTSDNKKFLREWFEVKLKDICFNASNIECSIQSKRKWFPYNKGGSFRKWYGNYDFVVNWEQNGKEIRNFKWPNGKIRSNIRNEEYYFKNAITWPLITSGTLSMRYRVAGSIHDVSGKSAFSDNVDLLKSILGFGNSKVMGITVKILNPTINFQNGDVVRVPILKIKDKKTVLNLVDDSISLSKSDWDAFETSWDFKRSPLLVNRAVTLEQAYNNWSQEALNRFNQLKDNEEELNRIFIDLYGLQDELTPEEDDMEVSVRKADQVRDIKAFLSYFIGCVFGRYSLDQDGLAYAGGDWNASLYSTFKPNKENIILLTDRQYFDDERDIIVRLREFLSKTFDPEHLTDNMNFIAQTLDPKKFERGVSAEQIIRDYFVNDFYKDHAKIYQKRPIYWEFNSGRNKGFKALMYLHRYTPEQLAMVRQYLHDLQPAMNDLIEIDNDLLDQETTASAKSKYRKIISTLNKQMNELVKYDQVLDHLSQSPVDLDLDDGVLANHDKLQQGEKLLTKL